MLTRWVLGLALALAAAAQNLPTPEEFAGFRMGADRKLLRWDRVVEYMRLVDSASDRVTVEDLGRTTNGNPYLNVIVSSAETLRDLPRYRDSQRRLAYPRDLPGPEFDKLAAGHKAVLLITCNIHSTEIAASQMALELVHRLATEDSPLVRHILNNVILLLVPSANPDGQIMVVDWYNRNQGTPFEYAILPDLYHKYTGHDNNRDAFMNTQVESRILNKLTYKDWFPQVYLDEHQMGNSGARIFVPPFRNPINPNIDPSIWQLNGMLGYAMGASLHDKGYTGIINDVMYTSWWQGGFVMQAWWHNMVGLLTEVASVAVATPVEQLKGPAPTAGPSGVPDPRKPLPPPSDTFARNTYPKPWMGGRWTLRDIVDYELAATWGLLEAVADQKHLLLRSFYNMSRRGIEQGRTTPPYAWVIPAQQHDRPAAARLLQILDELGVEVHQAKTAFKSGDREFPAGSWVVLMSQPFRAFAKDLLERQRYPEQRATPGGPVERPYDVTGWTLPLQMGVEAVEVEKTFDAMLTRVGPIAVPAGEFKQAGAGQSYYIPGTTNNARRAVNELLKSNVPVTWTASGDFVVPASAVKTDLRQVAQSLGVDVRPGTASSSGRRLRAPRTALYRPPMASMDEGWTRWVLEQYGFDYTSLTRDELRRGTLRERFDAIIIADTPKDALIRGTNYDWNRPEQRGGLGDEGVGALRRFVQDGGTLVTLGSASLVPVEEFPLPLRNALKGLRPDQFFCPGSILRIFVDTEHPVGYGMQREASAVFYNDVAFEPAPALGDAEVRTIARYPASGMLQSGWIGGESYLQDRIAAAEVTYGKGRVIVLGFSPQNRAQPHGTFKLLFNAIHLAAAEN